MVWLLVVLDPAEDVPSDWSFSDGKKEIACGIRRTFGEVKRSSVRTGLMGRMPAPNKLYALLVLTAWAPGLGYYSALSPPLGIVVEIFTMTRLKFPVVRHRCHQ